MIIASGPAPTVLRTAFTLGIAALLATGLSACSRTIPEQASRPGRLSPTSAATGAQTSSKSSTAATGSACALVTVDEVTAATGKPMGPGNDAGGICYFSATADPSVVVYVQIYSDPHSMAAPKDIESDSQHLPGLGDDAFWSTGGIVFVQKGNRAFTISIPSLALASANAPDAIVTLATAAAGRL